MNVKNQHVTVVRSFCWLCSLYTSTLHRSPFTDQIKSVQFKAFQNAWKAFGRPPTLKTSRPKPRFVLSVESKPNRSAVYFPWKE